MLSTASSSDWAPTVGRGPVNLRCSGVRYSKWSGANTASRTTATPRTGTRSARTNLSNKHQTNEFGAMQQADSFQLFCTKKFFFFFFNFPEKFIGHSVNIDYINEDYKIESQKVNHEGTPRLPSSDFTLLFVVIHLFLFNCILAFRGKIQKPKNKILWLSDVCYSMHFE